MISLLAARSSQARVFRLLAGHRCRPSSLLSAVATENSNAEGAEDAEDAEDAADLSRLMDFSELEKERGITISSKSVLCQWLGSADLRSLRRCTGTNAVS